MDDYIAIVHTDDLSYRILPTGERPYWSTTSTDGRYCFVSIAGEDRIDVVDYASERHVASIPVGDHVQRSRMGHVLTSVVGEPARPSSPRAKHHGHARRGCSKYRSAKKRRQCRKRHHRAKHHRD
jgi:hypothetical protein